MAEDITLYGLTVDGTIVDDTTVNDSPADDPNWPFFCTTRLLNPAKQDKLLDKALRTYVHLNLSFSARAC